MEIQKWYAGFVLLCVMILVMPGSIVAQDSTFSVESFIPQKFRDLELRIDGAIDFFRDDMHNYYDDQNPYGSEGGIFEVNEGLESEAVFILKYRYETPSKFYTVEATGSLSRTSRELNDSSLQITYLGDIVSWDRNNSQNTGYIYTFQPRIIAGFYAVSDLFISGTIGVPLYYSRLTSESKLKSWMNGVYLGEPTQLWGSHGKNTRKSDVRQYGISLELGTGFGRIYDGRYSVTSFNIINELSQRGFLHESPTYVQMIRLTEIVYQYRQKHIIDTRLHRIEGIEEIIDYLYRENLFSGKEVRGCLLIQDIWDYYPQEPRKFGMKFAIGFTIELGTRHDRLKTFRNFINYQITTDSLGGSDTAFSPLEDSYSKTYIENEQEKIYFTGGVEYHRPFNHKWQLSIIVEGRLLIEDDTQYGRYVNQIRPYAPGSFSKEGTEYRNNGELSGLVKMEYFYDSRTSLTFAIKGEGKAYRQRNYWFQSDNTKHYDQGFSYAENEFAVSSMIQYRISVPTTLRGHLSYAFFYGEADYGSYNPITKGDNLGFSLEIIHYLF